MSQSERAAMLLNEQAVDPRLEVVANFHERHIWEMSQYEACVNRIVSENSNNSRKIDLSSQRLIKQPLAYQILTLIWMSSPFPAGHSDWSNWESRDTVYSLASRLSQHKGDQQKLINYITRVVEAAEYYSLVKRGAEENFKRLIFSQSLLHKLMCEFAMTCLERSENNEAQS